MADRRKTFQGLMGSSAGIVRRQADMQRAKQAAAELAHEVQVLPHPHLLSPALLLLQHIYCMAVSRPAPPSQKAAPLHHRKVFAHPAGVFLYRPSL